LKNRLDLEQIQLESMIWDITPCSPLKVDQLATCFHAGIFSVYLALKTEAMCFYKTSVNFQRNKRGYNSQASTLHKHCRENLKSNWKSFYVTQDSDSLPTKSTLIYFYLYWASSLPIPCEYENSCITNIYIYDYVNEPTKWITVFPEQQVVLLYYLIKMLYIYSHAVAFNLAVR
jgi:hypothetical protein